MRHINQIVVHCSATNPWWMQNSSTSAKVAEIRRWHMAPPRNWSDIGYHLIIDRDGTVAGGRPMERTGAHTLGQNTGSIGVCLIGGRGGTMHDDFLANFTEEQEESLHINLHLLKQRFGDVLISGHNQYAAKACPCFNVPEWWRGVG